MNYTLVENPYCFEIHLANAAKSRTDLLGKTINNIVIMSDEIIISFEDKSCAIFNPDYEEFKEKFYSSELDTYGFLLDNKEVEKIKKMVSEKNKTVSLQYKKDQLARHRQKVAELENELSNS